jgi:hypothetical protein
LHPIKFKNLYSTIGQIFEQFVPMFNKVLTDMVNPTDSLIEVDPYDWYENRGDDDDEDDDEKKLKPIPIPPFVAPKEPSNPGNRDF